MPSQPKIGIDRHEYPMMDQQSEPGW